jgi:hypothetical protein
MSSQRALKGQSTGWPRPVVAKRISGNERKIPVGLLALTEDALFA